MSLPSLDHPRFISLVATSNVSQEQLPSRHFVFTSAKNHGDETTMTSTLELGSHIKQTNTFRSLHLNSKSLSIQSHSNSATSRESSSLPFLDNMSTHSNPFVQGGWVTSNFRPTADQLANPPSIYGALPMTTEDSAHSSSRSRGPTHFQFMNPNPTILNSVVATKGRDGSIQQLVRISTDERLAGYTAFKDASGKSVGLVEWVGGHPQVEVRGSVAKCGTGEWLKVVNDPSFGRPVRRMDVRGTRFFWCPNGEAILLYPQQQTARPLAVATKNRHAINLEMSEQALSWGLLEPSIVAITLLLSGRRLE